MGRDHWQELRKHAVGRVDQHEIVTPAGSRLGCEAARRVLPVDAHALQAELVDVLDDRLRSLPVGVHEDRAASAPRERLEPERARAGEEVEDVGAVDRADQVEHRLTNAVSGGPDLEASGREDTGALTRTRDYSQSARPPG